MGITRLVKLYIHTIVSKQHIYKNKGASGNCIKTTYKIQHCKYKWLPLCKLNHYSSTQLGNPNLGLGVWQLSSPGPQTDAQSECWGSENMRNKSDHQVAISHSIQFQCNSSYHGVRKAVNKSCKGQSWKNYLTLKGRERCLQQASKSIFGLAWPWPFDPQGCLFRVVASQVTCDNWHQNGFIHFQNITLTNSVTDKQTDGQSASFQKMPASWVT